MPSCGSRANPGGRKVINAPGSFHNVSATDNCTPSDPVDGCSASVATIGFTLTGRIWSFTPSDAEVRVMYSADAIFALFGWWNHKASNGGDFTASTSAANQGTVPPAANIDTLMGTAAYSGDSAGKYALTRSTSGTNDAGYFIADATLEANFIDDAITGTMDNIMGTDGMSRDWSVELKTSAVAATSGITRTADEAVAGNPMTVWTISGTVTTAGCEWSGTLLDNGENGVPKVATGTFYSTYDTAGSLVGVFGANVDQPQGQGLVHLRT